MKQGFIASGNKRFKTPTRLACKGGEPDQQVLGTLTLKYSNTPSRQKGEVNMAY